MPVEPSLPDSKCPQRQMNEFHFRDCLRWEHCAMFRRVLLWETLSIIIPLFHAIAHNVL